MEKFTMYEIKAKCPLFFSRETMKFFGSRIEGGIIQGKYFITSENNFDGTKRFFLFVCIIAKIIELILLENLIVFHVAQVQKIILWNCYQNKRLSVVSDIKYH